VISHLKDYYALCAIVGLFGGYVVSSKKSVPTLKKTKKPTHFLSAWAFECFLIAQE
jgi:hypothetical protein